MNKPRKPIADLIEELKSWLPNYDHGPKDYPTLLWRVLASMPGGDEAEDMGYEAFSLGWREIDQLGRVLVAIQDKRDVEDLIAGLIHDEEEEGVEEAQRRPPPRVMANPMAAPSRRGSSQASRTETYGDKRDYPKIEIYVDGSYVATTTWARTVKQAVEQYAKKNGLDVRRVTARRQETGRR